MHFPQFMNHQPADGGVQAFGKGSPINRTVAAVVINTIKAVEMSLRAAAIGEVLIINGVQAQVQIRSKVGHLAYIIKHSLVNRENI